MRLSLSVRAGSGKDRRISDTTRSTTAPSTQQDTLATNAAASATSYRSSAIPTETVTVANNSQVVNIIIAVMTGWLQLIVTGLWAYAYSYLLMISEAVDWSHFPHDPSLYSPCMLFV